MANVPYSYDTVVVEQAITDEPDSYDTSTSPTTSTGKKSFDYNTITSYTSTCTPRRRLSAHAQADADRAMRHTNSWTPVVERRQSWNREDMKHELHIMRIATITTGPGFTEKKSAETPRVKMLRVTEL
ncbi:hypothetical protein QQZ08_009241 [Neonectria magnoliae]|uniref:Uncharacterized protein n=1 Tax=Neonectria magnoliae TaxID=2732573 RepID=A0ABR1HQ57_9HYPO